MSAIGVLLRRLGLDDVAIGRDDVRRLLVLLVVCAACALLVVDYARAPVDALKVGDVAQRSIKAPFTFTYADHAAHERMREEARAAALPVYVYRTDLVEDRAQRISAAFAAGRERLTRMAGAQTAEGAQTEGGQKLNEELQLVVVQAFLEPLAVQLPEDDIVALMKGGFPPGAEGLARELLDRAMREVRIVLSRDQLPQDRRSIRVIRLHHGDRSEEVVGDLESILVPEEARQRVSLGMLETKGASGREADAAAGIARALVTANLTFDPLETEDRREAAANAVPLELETVKRGQILFRAGEVVTATDLEMYRALQEHQGDHDLSMEVLAIALFLVLLLASLYHFAAAYLSAPTPVAGRGSASGPGARGALGFSTRVRDVAAVGGLLVLTTLTARMVVASSEGLAQVVGYEAEPRSVWFVVPVAGAVMLVRLLLGTSWTVVFAIAVSAVCGLVMELQALPVLFFLISSVAAASAVEHTRERIAVVRAGAVVGVVNAVAVLLIHLVQLFVVEGELSLATQMRPFWSMSFAFAGGVLSAFLVLGLVPLFESVGFVTDYRLMELANLNHPLLRQLMLRAPGSYHHSVLVGTLAEAGAEAIGANALVAKVASYFHDIGKGLKPQYFVENQQGGINQHAGLDPHVSARIIISHVIDGGRMAREHGLPQPILDNIFMHHGTGILQYFYADAVARAGDPSKVDPEAFRYPGPKPCTREAGVIMLADKVEAATRTLRVPDEENIRGMIVRIVNSVIAERQFAECPLTFQEIQVIADTYTKVLVGIYHQRIEYPQTADLSRGSADQAGQPAAARSPQPRREATITLDLEPAQKQKLLAAARPQSSQETPTPAERELPETTAPGFRAEALAAELPDLPPTDDTSDVIDYEAVDYLPRGE